MTLGKQGTLLFPNIQKHQCSPSPNEPSEIATEPKRPSLVSLSKDVSGLFPSFRPPPLYIEPS